MARYQGRHKQKRKLRFKKMNIVWLIGLIFSIKMLYDVISIDILPTKFVVLAVAAYIVINLVLFILINLKNKLARAIFFIFLVLFCNANIIGNYYVNKTFSFLRTSLGATSKDAPTVVYNIFASGHDFDGFRDFNMIITVNVTQQKILMTSIPRDYYIDVIGLDGYKGKEKLSFIKQGIDISTESIENLFDTKIDYYVDIDTSSVVKLVDTIGGIEYCNKFGDYYTTHAQVLDTYNDSQGEKLHVKPGCQHVNGIQTLTISRERLKLPGGDRARQENVQIIMMSIFNKMASPELIKNFDSILKAVDGMYETTVPMNAVTELVKDTMANGNNWKFDNQAVDGSDTHAPVALGTANDWVMMPNKDSVAKATEKIKDALKK